MSRIAVFYNLDRPPASRLKIWTDVRLDNRDELVAALGDAATDDELILKAYTRWGDDCASHLLGDFAFVIWDHLRRRLYAARDHVGIRQLSYYFDGRVFACASLPEQLFDYPEVEARPDLQTLANYLLDRFPDANATLYQGIRRLPGGHYMSVTGSGISLHRYWDPANSASIPCRSDDEIVAGFRDVLATAIRSRLSETPVACALSGGLDSSAIACLGRHIAPDLLTRAYSMVFDELPCDERRYIDETARHTGIEVEHCPTDSGKGSLPLSSFNPDRFPGVPCDATFLMSLDWLERARAQGMRVLLWGLGGDELLTSGDAYLSDFIRQRRLLAAAHAVGYRIRHAGIAEWKSCFTACLRPIVPGSVKAIRRKRKPFSPPRWISKQFLLDSGALRQPALPRRTFDCEALQLIYDGLTSGRTVGYTLPGTDALAAAFSLEFRHPFLDRRVIEFVFGIPTGRGEFFAGKLLLKEALSGILPETVRTRLDKTCFTPLIARGFRREFAKIYTLLESSHLGEVGAIDRKALEEVFRLYSDQERRATLSPACDSTLALFLRAETWLRRLKHLQRNQYGQNGRTEPTHQEVLLASTAGLVRECR